MANQPKKIDRVTVFYWHEDDSYTVRASSGDHLHNRFTFPGDNPSDASLMRKYGDHISIKRETIYEPLQDCCPYCGSWIIRPDSTDEHKMNCVSCKGVFYTHV